MNVHCFCEVCGHRVSMRAQQGDNTFVAPAVVVLTATFASLYADPRYGGERHAFDPWCEHCERIPKVVTELDDYFEKCPN